MAEAARSARAGAAVDPVAGVASSPEGRRVYPSERRPAQGHRRRRSLTSPSRFIIRTDGAARGNPGPASLGAVLVDASRPDARDPLAPADASISEYLGAQTNNVAEYTGVVRALALAAELGAREVHLLLDSKLIVEQLAGRWRVKDAKLIPLHIEARRILRSFDRWTAAHVPRAQNSAADALANEAIDRVAAGGPAVAVVRPRRD
ncbi:MAG: ribonuclease HI family protein [Chloroflexota bacterium]|nr:ribonuclease HI family protein [Chloroflexota bacterium]